MLSPGPEILVYKPGTKKVRDAHFAKQIPIYRVDYWCWLGRIRCSPVPKAQQMSLKYISILRRSPVHNVKRLLPSRLTNQTQILCGTSMVMVLPGGGGGGGETMFAASRSHDRQGGRKAARPYMVKPFKNHLGNQWTVFNRTDDSGLSLFVQIITLG